MKQALGKQGVCGIVLTPNAEYIGNYEDKGIAWQLPNVEVDIIENVTVNRGLSNDTGQDIALSAFNILCPPGPNGTGKFNPRGYEQGEDNGLVVNRITFDTALWDDGGASVGYVFWNVSQGETTSRPGDFREGQEITFTSTVEGAVIQEATVNGIAQPVEEGAASWTYTAASGIQFLDVKFAVPVPPPPEFPDEFCEWVYSEGNAYIDTGINLSSASDPRPAGLQLSCYADIKSGLPSETSEISGNYPLNGFYGGRTLYSPTIGIGAGYAKSANSYSAWVNSANNNMGKICLSGDAATYDIYRSVAWTPDAPTFRLEYYCRPGTFTMGLLNYEFRTNNYKDSADSYGNPPWTMRNLYTNPITGTGHYEDAPMYVFAHKLTGGAMGYGSTPAMKVTRFECALQTANGVKRVVLVPAKKSGVSGMYDLVGHKMYYNANSVGQFVCGPAIGAQPTRKASGEWKFPDATADADQHER